MDYGASCLHLFEECFGRARVWALPRAVESWQLDLWADEPWGLLLELASKQANMVWLFAFEFTTNQATESELAS
jgi:hypothetical protein